MMTVGGDTKEDSNGGITDAETIVNTTDLALIEESEPPKDAEQPPPESALIPVEKPKDVDDLVMNDVKEEEDNKKEEEKDPDDNAARDSPPDAVAGAGDKDIACPIQVDATTTDFKAMSNAASVDHNGVLDHVKDHVDGQEYSIVKEEGVEVHPSSGNNSPESQHAEADAKGPDFDKVEADEMNFSSHAEVKEELLKPDLASGHASASKASTSDKPPFFWEYPSADGYESGTEEEQAAFRREVETFYRENHLEFKAPKFYKEDLNLLKLWRQVVKLGGYEQVTSCKLWRQVGESFKPPKTCTTVSWTFRIFYEKALVEYEKHRMKNGGLPFSDGSLTDAARVESQGGGSQALGSGRARRDAAARAMQGWHSERLLDNGQVCHPIIKDKNLSSTPKSDKQLKTNGLLKRKKPSTDDRAVHITPMKAMKPQLRVDTVVYDIGPPAEWVKINVQKTIDCFEVYALVPGLLREEVHVQSDPAGRLIISGQPEHVDNPWGITAFKKVVSLPSRIDPHQTSAVVTLHGQLFIRVPFEQSDK